MNDNDVLPINSLRVSRITNVIDDGGESIDISVKDKSECKLDINSLLKELSTADTNIREDLDLVVEFIRRRLELVFDDPDLVYNLKLLENLDKLYLSDRIKYLEDKISNLEQELTRLSDDYFRLINSLQIVKDAFRNI